MTVLPRPTSSLLILAALTGLLAGTALSCGAARQRADGSGADGADQSSVTDGGSDGSSIADAPAGQDVAQDGPPPSDRNIHQARDMGSVPDGGDGPAAGLGQQCSSTAASGQPGSCNVQQVCCDTVATPVCAVQSDCPGEPGFKLCGSPADCPPEAVCCHGSSLGTLCTAAERCAAYGGSFF
jgi:hypothetical protein